MTNPKWLGWMQQVQALAQDGLAYSQNPFDIERYHLLRNLAARIVAEYGPEEFERIDELFSGEAGYATPKLDARGVVFREGKLLLVKELLDGGWTLPGGWVDVGESPGSAVEREVFEESGFRVRAVKLLAIFDRNNPRHGHPAYIFQIYKMFFLCELIGGEATDSIETSGAAFFGEDEIPPLSVSRTSPTQIQRLFEHLRDPHLPADFD